MVCVVARLSEVGVDEIGLQMKDRHDFEMQTNRSKDFIGSLERISMSTSSGK